MLRHIITFLIILVGLTSINASAEPIWVAKGADKPKQVAYNNSDQTQSTYKGRDLINAGHQFFGAVSGNLASVIERIVSINGEPNGYILGEEATGAFVAGLRFGEGQLFTRNAGQHKLFWQGPSIGFDAGGDGNRTMMLVYGLPEIDSIYRRYAGVNGSAYLVGGLGITLLANKPVKIIPIRSGIGARLGINVGYVKFTPKPTWNPF